MKTNPKPTWKLEETKRNSTVTLHNSNIAGKDKKKMQGSPSRVHESSNEESEEETGETHYLPSLRGIRAQGNDPI